MSIGGSGGTTVKSAALVAAPFGLAVVAVAPVCCLGSFCAVLPDGMVPDIICPRGYVCVRILGWSCVLRSFHTAVRQQSSFFVSPPSPDAPCLIPHDGCGFSFFEQVVHKHFKTRTGREFTIFGFGKIISSTYFYANTIVRLADHGDTLPNGYPSTRVPGPRYSRS